MHIFSLSLCCAVMLCALPACILPATAAPNGTAATPPMGWNPWNAFRTEVTEAKILAVAAKMKESGLADAGYRYVNVDDGWWLRRSANGRIEVRTSMFPSAARADGSTSLRPFVDKLHGMGLKAGLYTDIGRNACSQAWDPGSPNLPAGSLAEREVGTFGFQAQDMQLLFGEWKFDFVKVDACGLADYGPAQARVKEGRFRAFGPWIVRGDPARSAPAQTEALYASLARALAQVRPDGDYVLSVCAWGEARAADWGHKVGQMWRTSADIRGTWDSMLHNFDSAARRPLYAGPGRWNDPDMLKVGLGEFDAEHLVAARAHMSLWAVIAAPLILGADLTRAPDSILGIVGRRAVIAVNQDPAGHQGVTVARDGDTQVLVKSLAAPGHKAVALVNRGDTPRRLSVALSQLDLDPTDGVRAHDLWSGKDHPVAGGRIDVDLQPRETALLRVEGRERPGGIWVTSMPARVRVLADGAAALPPVLRAAWVPVQANAAPSGAPLALDGKPVDHGIGALANSRIALRLDGEFRRLRIDAGVMAAPELGRQEKAVTWRVFGDGKLLFERAAARAGIDVPVSGVREVWLSTDASGPAVVAWGAAELQR